MYAVMFGELECTMAIVGTGANVDARNENGQTAGDLNPLSACILIKDL